MYDVLCTGFFYDEDGGKHLVCDFNCSEGESERERETLRARAKSGQQRATIQKDAAIPREIIQALEQRGARET